MFPTLFLLGFILETVTRPKIVIGTLLLAAVASGGILLATNLFVVTRIDMLIRILLMCAVNAITLVVLEGYPCHLRFVFVMYLPIYSCTFLFHLYIQLTLKICLNVIIKGSPLFT